MYSRKKRAIIIKTVKLIPALKETIWGGQRLKALYGGEEMQNIAESWVLSCHDAGACVICGGESEGKTLARAIREADENVLGAHCGADGFPVLIKLIDAADRLSVQVHPDNEYARVHENENGKTECWYILDCDEGAELIFGMADALTKEQFAACIRDNALLEHVRRVKVHKGDVAFIPAGTLHAIGKGILLAEVQQSSDTTYRVYDYGRLQNGKPRELHVEKAVEVTDLTPATASLAPMGALQHKDGWDETLLVHCAYFNLYRETVQTEYRDFCDETSFVSLVVTEGSGVYCDGDCRYDIKKGDSLFIPAGTGAFTVTGNAEILKTTV